MRRGALYVLVTGVVAVVAGVLLFITVASASTPDGLGPKVVVPSEPTEPGSTPGGDDGATKVPGPSPSTAGDDDAGEDDSDDDADDDADD